MSAGDEFEDAYNDPDTELRVLPKSAPTKAVEQATTAPHVAGMDGTLDVKPGTPASSEAPLATPASATAPVSTTASPVAPHTSSPNPAPAPEAPTSPRRRPLDLDASPSETGDTPMATAPTSPATPTIHDKPRLGGRGPTVRPQGRSVSQTMALAYAEMANESATSTAGEAGEGGDAEGGEGGETRKGGEREEGDDEWVAFVRSQLVRLFPDFHPEDTDTEAVEGEGGAEREEGEDGPPSLSAELLPMRTEIGVLRGIVAELTAVQGPPLQDVVTQAGEEKPDTEGPGGTPPQPEPLSSPSTEESESTAIAIAAKEDDAPPTPSLDPVTLGLALAVVRALDASHFSSIPVLTLRSDEEIFAPSNLQHLLTLASTLSTSPSQLSRGHCHGNGSPSHTPTPTHAHDHLNAHEKIKKAHDVSITPEVGTPPTPVQEECFADEMRDEVLEE